MIFIKEVEVRMLFFVFFEFLLLCNEVMEEMFWNFIEWFVLLVFEFVFVIYGVGGFM